MRLPGARRALQLGQGGLVAHQGYVGMHLQDGGGNLGGDRAGKGGPDDVRLVRPADHHQDVPDRGHADVDSTAVTGHKSASRPFEIL